MDSYYLRHVLKRLFIFSMLLVGFSLLPGPRALLDKVTDYLLSPNSLSSMWAGMHLSLIHFCWLLGFEIPQLVYDEGVDTQLAAFVFLVSVIVQVSVAVACVIAYRMLFMWYDDDVPDPEVE